MLKNITADLVRDMLKRYLSLRVDICSCSKCKIDMLAYILSRVPAKYVTTDTGAMQTVIEQAKFENETEIMTRIIEAVERIKKNPRHEVQEDKKKAFQLLLNNIYLERGVDFSRYQPSLLERRIGVRMSANGVNSYSDYLRVLLIKPEEYTRLFDALTISVTEFFRDPDVFEAVKKVLMQMMHEKRKNQDFSVNIWSAGCSTGEEPYSIAILIKEVLKETIVQFKIDITGTDIDEQCLKTAEKGRYTMRSLRNIDQKLLLKYFSAVDDEYQINEGIRRLVTFRVHNMISDKPLENLDMVFCRNVFIFFNRSLQEHLIMTFSRAIKRGGYFVQGGVEALLGEAKILFDEVDALAKIYRKK
jgi:chemotaxis methyl-accepting protein methylase